MTAPSTSPLAERAARAFIAKLKEFCPECDIWDQAAEEDRQQAIVCMESALAACHAEEMAEALRTLVYAKNEKEKHGETERHLAMKQRGWTRAREVLARLDGKPTEDA